MILQNKTIDAIAERRPQNREEFIQIKGLGERKFDKYGTEILGIINGTARDDIQEMNESSLPFFSDENYLSHTLSKQVLSVSQLLDIVKEVLRPLQFTVCGEISSVRLQRHLYFSIKDPKDESKLEAIMWETDLSYCGIKPAEGLEVILHGYMDIYKPTGKASFIAQTMELVGEGALKKAYDELKIKLEKEGLFDPERKRELPEFPVRLGVVTSRYGAVIHDLLNNLGKYGYKIQLYDARVEGALAIKELITALHYFRDKPIDLLLIIRGGGSLESLQAFNNEALIRSVSDFPVPVIAGIGHEQDVPLFSLVADAAFSTPTAVAREVNRSWDRAQDKLRYYENTILNKYVPVVLHSRHTIEEAFYYGEIFLGRVKQAQHFLQRNMDAMVNKLQIALNTASHHLERFSRDTCQQFSAGLDLTKKNMEHQTQNLQKNNPERQLKLGYSMVFLGKKLVSHVRQVNPNDLLEVRLADGELHTRVQDIKQRSEDGKLESNENP